MEKLKNSPLWEKAKYICSTLNDYGYVALVAGGAVRDAAMGVSPRDFDIATDADTDELEKIFPDTHSVGKIFGTVVVVIDGINFEVTRFRKDGEYKDGRRPSNIEFSNPEEDAKRRDFTVNALFYDPVNDKVIDYVEGQKDLEAGKLRFVGDALSRIREDKLRIMRGVRFVGQLGFELDQSAFDAIKSYAYTLPQVSQERITDEFKKMIYSKNACAALNVFESAGLFPVVFNELNQVWETSVAGGQETVYRDPFTMAKLMLTQTRKYESPLFTLASFFAPFSFWVKEIKQMKNWHSYLISLKYSKNEATRIENFMRHLNSLTETLDYSTIKRMFSQRGGELTRLSLHCQNKVFPIDPTNLALARSYEEGHAPGMIDLPRQFVTGKDLLSMGLMKGKIVGELLDEAFDLQLNGKLGNREDALDWLDKRIEELKAEDNPSLESVDANQLEFKVD